MKPLVALLCAGAAFAAEPDALLWAVHRDDAAEVDRLLNAGAKVGEANRYGVTPLLEACLNGNAAIVEKLLRAGADPNTTQPEGETALMTASRTGNVDVVKLLLDRGARVNAKEKWRGQTALMWAAAERHSAVVLLLLQHGADVNARSRVFDFTDIMPRQGSVPMNYPRGGFTALLFAARQGDLASGRALVNAKADLNRGDPDGVTPLIEAIVNFHYDFAAVLLDRGANPNTPDDRGRTPLYAAVDMHSLDTSTRPNPARADTLDSLDIVKALLARGANANAQLSGALPPRGPLDVADYTLGPGATPFLRAAKSDDVEVMRLLLAKGANPLLATKEGVTPLMAAAGVGWRDGKSHGSESDAIEAIKLCLDHGAKINAVGEKGQTALQGASQRGADTVIAYLMSHGADLNAKDDQGHNTVATIVQTFSAKVSALGTSTGGFSPSTPASLACDGCSGTLTAATTVPWLAITSIGTGSVGFNVFSNTGTSPRTGVVQVAGAGHKVSLTIEQAGSTAPLLSRQVAYLYQRILGHEPDAAATKTPLPGLADRLLNSSEALETDFSVMAMYQAINGTLPDYSAWWNSLQARKTGAAAQSQFSALLRGSACSKTTQATVECLYSNLAGRLPTPAELAAGTSLAPFQLFEELVRAPLPTLHAAVLYYTILERAPSQAELSGARTADIAGGAEFLGRFR